MSRTTIAGLAAVLGAFLTLPTLAQEEAKPIKAGIIGLDTSHAIAFSQALNAPKPKPELAGVRIVAAYPHGSREIPSSRDRIPDYTKQVKEKFGVEIVDSIDDLLKKVDVVFLETNDGQLHREQAEAVFKAGKPVFIDKPVAASLADVLRIYDLAKQYNVPCFSSSSLRFSPSIASMRDHPQVGEVHGCSAYSPCALEPHHVDLYWYGIHGVESLYTVMGTGCETVARVQVPDGELVTGVWKGGRIGTFRGLRTPKSDYGVLVFGSKGIVHSHGYGGYDPLVVEIVKFFKSGKPPVSAEETIELYAFMEAADESKRRGGQPVRIADVLAKARAEAASAASGTR